MYARVDVANSMQGVAHISDSEYVFAELTSVQNVLIRSTLWRMFFPMLSVNAC